MSGPLQYQGRGHEFLSRFNLFSEYRAGPDNTLGDQLSRWAYRAGTVEAINFHGGDADLAGWQEEVRKKRGYIGQKLQDQYPLLHAAVHAVNGWNASEVESKLQLI